MAIVNPNFLLKSHPEINLPFNVNLIRNTPGSRVNMNGIVEVLDNNTVRHDYDSITEEYNGILIENSRTNLITLNLKNSRCQYLTSTNVSNCILNVAPYEVIEDLTNDQHIIYLSRTGVNETLTLSTFLRRSNRTKALLQFSNFSNSASFATFDLSNGTIVGTSAQVVPDYTNTTASIIPCENDWYKCSLTATKGSINNTNNPTILLANDTNSAIFQGNGYSSIYFSGIQLEVGNVISSYIMANTSQVTYNADLYTINSNSILNLQSNKNTIYYEFKTPKIIKDTQTIYSIDDGTTNNIIQLQSSVGTLFANVKSNGILQTSLNMGNIANNTIYKSAFVLNKNSFSCCINGGNIQYSNSGSIPIVTTFRFGCDYSSSNFLNGYFRVLANFPTNLSNSEIQRITT